jgi:hypothetical protein
VSWSRKFDEPIKTPDGKRLSTWNFVHGAENYG